MLNFTEFRRGNQVQFIAETVEHFVKKKNFKYVRQM